ncbi:MAG: zinc ribbon domain-containing protein [Deltaproteobacteria bacterium]|nr:zinc ribbon domain-containing protein [Candidatus Zymogenaceae bacterium]
MISITGLEKHNSRRNFVKKGGAFILSFSSLLGIIPVINDRFISTAYAINFCPYCGTELPPGAKFCPKCGKSLDFGGESDTPLIGEHKCEMSADRSEVSGYLTGPGDVCSFTLTLESSPSVGVTDVVEILFYGPDDAEFRVKWGPPYRDQSFEEIQSDYTIFGSPSPELRIKNCYKDHTMVVNFEVYSKKGYGAWHAEISWSVSYI